MASASPPKPWERAGAASSNLTAPLPNPTTTSASPAISSTAAPVNSATAGGAPAIPSRPTSVNAIANRNASAYSGSTMNRPYGSYGSSPYGYGSSPYGYSSPYNRFGGGYGGGMYGSSMYGGSMYGGGMYGGGMYGAGGMYGGMPGDPNDPNNPQNSLTNNFQQSTQATFQLIESIVGAFGGFAQMLESTYMATHSSFFAMVSVAEQFGNLRQTLGSVLGIYAILRWLRTAFAKLTGRPPPADATALTPSAFRAFANGEAAPGPLGPDGRPMPKPSKKPFIIFILAVFGLPYLMGKLIKALAKSQEEAMNGQNPGAVGPDGQPQNPQQRTFDASQLEFCRVLYDFPPQEAVSAGNFDSNMDLPVKKGDLVAVLDKSDPSGLQQESQWWRCRSRDGHQGYLPVVYLEPIQRRPAAIENGVASRSNTMPASVAPPPKAADPASRAATMSSSATAVSPDDQKVQKLKDFQKAWVNER